MRNILLRIAYDGTDFSGWQIQPGRPTIQGTLADVFAILASGPQITGAGRTDAGVHAEGQAASVRLVSPIPCANLVLALNDRLPESIRVFSAEDVRFQFHARRDARSKIYRYRIHREPICPPSLVRYVHPFPYRLDEEAMSVAARAFEGEKDFRSFASLDAAARASRANGEEDAEEERSTVRTIYSSLLERAGAELVYTVEGSGFLHHMVRNIVGTLIEVGRGNLSSDAIPSILAAVNRSAAGPTAPARGLCLVEVKYDLP